MITVSLSIIQITHMKNYFVTGTDTGVGKTYFISKFTQQFMNSISINIVKPIESGCELKNGNLVAYDTGIYSEIISKDISKICKYPLQGQFSPHRALKEINKEVNLNFRYPFVGNFLNPLERYNKFIFSVNSISSHSLWTLSKSTLKLFSENFFDSPNVASLTPTGLRKGEKTAILLINLNPFNNFF